MRNDVVAWRRTYLYALTGGASRALPRRHKPLSTAAQAATTQQTLDDRGRVAPCRVVAPCL